MVPPKFLCPSDPTLARALERTEQNVELRREVREVREGLAGRIGRGQGPSVTATGLNTSAKRWKVLVTRRHFGVQDVRGEAGNSK